MTEATRVKLIAFFTFELAASIIVQTWLYPCRHTCLILHALSVDLTLVTSVNIEKTFALCLVMCLLLSRHDGTNLCNSVPARSLRLLHSIQTKLKHRLLLPNQDAQVLSFALRVSFLRSLTEFLYRRLITNASIRGSEARLYVNI